MGVIFVPNQQQIAMLDNLSISQDRVKDLVQTFEQKDNADQVAQKFAAEAQRMAQTDAMQAKPSAEVGKITNAAETGTLKKGHKPQGVMPRPATHLVANTDMAYGNQGEAPEASEALGNAAAAPALTEAEAAAPAKPLQTVEPEPQDGPAGASYNLENHPMAMAFRQEKIDAEREGRAFSEERATSMGRKMMSDFAADGGAWEVSGRHIARDVAAQAKANGKPMSAADEQKLADAINVEKGGTVTTGGQMAAYYRLNNLPGAEAFGGGEAAAGAAGSGEATANGLGSKIVNFFTGGSGSSFVSKVAAGAGIGIAGMAMANPIISMIPGAGASVALLGMGGALATVGMLGKSTSRMSGGEDPYGLGSSGVFAGLGGLENEIRNAVAQATLGGKGGNALYSMVGQGGGGSFNIAALAAAMGGGGGGMGVGSGGFLTGAGGTGGFGGFAMAGAGIASSIGGLSATTGLAAGRQGQAADAALYGDSTNRIKASQGSITRTASMIAATQNRAIDIDDLIMMFAAYTMKEGEEDIREMTRRLGVKKLVEEKKNLLKEQWNRTRGKAEQEGKMAGGAISAIGSAFGPLGGMVGSLVGGKVAEAAVKPFDMAEQSGAKDAAFNMLSGQGLYGEEGDSVDALQLKVQSAVEKYKRNYELISNLMKARYDTSMTAVNNMRA